MDSVSSGRSNRSTHRRPPTTWVNIRLCSATKRRTACASRRPCGVGTTPSGTPTCDRSFVPLRTTFTPGPFSSVSTTSPLRSGHTPGGGIFTATGSVRFTRHSGRKTSPTIPGRRSTNCTRRGAAIGRSTTPFVSSMTGLRGLPLWSPTVSFKNFDPDTICSPYVSVKVASLAVVDLIGCPSSSPLL